MIPAHTPSSAAKVGASPPSQPAARNPGPGWGYRFLIACDRVLPEFLFRPARAAGTWIALAAMPGQRRHSRDYLRIILGREPRGIDTFRHFFAFEESLMLKLRVASGRAAPDVVLSPESADLRRFLADDSPALFGTFHIGHSDLVGFLLGGREKRRVSMIRQRVGNSHDTEQLGALFGDWVSFIWVNETENLLFALKNSVEAGDCIALKCDRVEFSAKTEGFDFLGARRLFPFTIYHLALIFNRPVMLVVAVPDANGATIVHGAPRWEVDASLDRRANLERAREHFQSFLAQVDALLRANPYQWFNYIPLNPEAPAA